LFLFVQKLRNIYADAQFADVNIGGRDACANWQCWRRQFSTMFL